VREGEKLRLSWYTDRTEGAGEHVRALNEVEGELQADGPAERMALIEGVGEKLPTMPERELP